jgi:hypothetical protein
MRKHIVKIALLLASFSTFSMAEDRIVLEVTTIKGNEELPKILYIVPWKEIEQSKNEEQKLVLHSLFGDLFDPAYPLQ